MLEIEYNHIILFYSKRVGFLVLDEAFATHLIF